MTRIRNSRFIPKIIIRKFSDSKFNNKETMSNSQINNKTRFNDINLQMISSKLYTQIFGNKYKSQCNNCSNNKSDILSIKEVLENFNISTECTSKIPNIDISIPELQGQNIIEHFELIAFQQVEPYFNIITQFLNELPPLPDYFIFNEGWTRYMNGKYESVSYPKEDGLIFDVEVCMKNGPLPTLATAVSKTSWYTWVSKYLIEGRSNFVQKVLTPDVLIPLESSKNDSALNLNEFQLLPKIIIGHNVSYDRIRIKEQYWLNTSGTRFLDTMALHICISGMSSDQRNNIKSEKLNTNNESLSSLTSLNNLSDVYKLYCQANLDKSGRDIFVDGELHEIKENFNTCMLYCASDVIATHKILQKVFPLFIERFPHPATLAGMLELNSAYLPVNYNWNKYIEEAETTYNALSSESIVCLSKRADQVCRLLIDNKYKQDPWMWDEDWSIKTFNLKKGFEKIYTSKNASLPISKQRSKLKKQFQYLNDTKYFLPKKIPHLSGYPSWYRKLCQKQKSNINYFSKAHKISTSMLITPKLLNLTWDSHPLQYIEEYGWGILIPFNSISNLKINLTGKKLLKKLKINNTISYKEINYDEEEFNALSQNLIFGNDLPNCLDINENTSNSSNKYFFFKLPHKNGLSYNVGNPLAKDFLTKFSENGLGSINNSALRILEISNMSSYWKNNRDRILTQLVIWLNSEYCNLRKSNVINFGAIIPQVISSGTLTRRAVEPTWMTASNANFDRIGSELRAMVNAPTNFSIIGADVDSQELWIASIIGDAYTQNTKIQGGTPFSWMTLIGNKSEGTDMHSVTAKAIGISRDQAKVINYARIYGAGQKFAERLLKQFNPAMSDNDAAVKSKRMFLMTKGQKLYRLNKSHDSEYNDKLYTSNEAFKISKIYGKQREQIFEKGRWFGGSESAMFNSLEEIAEQNQPCTPFLNARLTRALENEVHGKYLPTKINWVVQSAAVDFLHLILVCMRWLMENKAKLCLSFHDEVRYLVPSEYKYNAALAMHVTNLLVRSFFVSKLKMNDLPMSVAFFTTVEVDSVLRKEATQDCKTPSNPYGLKEGYGIQHGESLNIFSAVKKSKGHVGVVNLKKI